MCMSVSVYVLRHVSLLSLRCRGEIDCASVSDKGRRLSTSPIVVRSRKDASTLLEK